MPHPFTPYTYIQCPCSEAASSSTAATRDAISGASDPAAKGDQQAGHPDEDDRAFDPRSARANYSLYPIEHLLYCEDCHQIRCPRCVAEEIVTYFCPNCLFEVPTSNLKSDGNRCTRSCFQCPVCIAPLDAKSVETPSSGPSEAGPAHTPKVVLSCNYCQWTSAEIGIQFDKQNGLYSQLAKTRNGGTERLTPRERRERRKQLASAVPTQSADDSEKSQGVTATGRNQSDEGAALDKHLDLETQFSNLRQFYQHQISESAGGIGGLSSLSDLGFGSPASLNRIMSMYTSGLAGGSSRSDRKGQSPLKPMREAQDDNEGLLPAELNEAAAIARLHEGLCKLGQGNDSGGIPSWDITTSSEQREMQPVYAGEGHLHGQERFLEELRPIPFLLRTKRSKRCPVCRHIITKPEAKSSNNRFRIRLVAESYIPKISIRPLNSPPAVPSSTSRTSSVVAAAASASANLLEPLKPVQYILTFKNPIFDSVKVTLATPSTTPGRFSSRVTLLCPQFEIDSNTDVWDDALRDNDRGGSSRRGEDGQPHQAIPGKIWERGRNWVSTVLEVVPPSLNLDLLAMSSKPIGTGGEAKKVDLSPLREDEDIVEIPMFVRIEWETDAAQDGVGSSVGKDKDVKEKREMAYWCVLGIGRIRQG